MRIEVEDLYFSYPSGVEALRGVRLEIESGQKVAIIGQNGSGKTTLVKHLNGLLRPTRGAVRIGDWVTTGRSVAQLAARVGYVFQNPDDQLFKGAVHDEIRFGPANLGWPAKQIESQVQAAANLLGLAGRLEINPYDLSPTWRKRVAMAAVLAMNTPIVVLDEPTTGQDYHSVQELAEILSTLHGQGKTIIAISHDIDFVAEHFAAHRGDGRGPNPVGWDAGRGLCAGRTACRHVCGAAAIDSLGDQVRFGGSGVYGGWFS